jgi:hypothetical protein
MIRVVIILCGEVVLGVELSEWGHGVLSVKVSLELKDHIVEELSGGLEFLEDVLCHCLLFN